VEVPHSYIAACAVFCIELPRCATLDTWMQYLRNATLLAVLLHAQAELWARAGVDGGGDEASGVSYGGKSGGERAGAVSGGTRWGVYSRWLFESFLSVSWWRDYLGKARWLPFISERTCLLLCG